MSTKSPPKRRKEGQLNIRVSGEQRARLNAAIAHLERKNAIPGARVSLGGWVLAVALTEADRILGKD